MKSKLALNLAENTKRLMDERGWSQRDVGKKANISQSGVGYVLRYKDAGDRHATIDTVEALAVAFGVQPSELLSSAKARTLHVVAEQGSPYKTQAPAHELDQDLLALVLEQAERLPGLSVAQRAALVTKAYAAFATDDRPPTATRILRVLRSA